MGALALTETNTASLSLSRRPYGRGFRYYNEEGLPVRQPKLLRRIKKLTIPPMWKDVKINENENGHIQAIGRDAKGRKQYIYHEEWERQRQQKKFAKLIDFGLQLPKIRKYAHQAIKLKGWPRRKVLALMILILDDTGIRIGNKQYQDRNGTFGLSTLRRKHIRFEERNKLVFEFQGKSTKSREVEIKEQQLISLIRRVAQQPGYEIFRYQDQGNKWCVIDSDEVNAFIGRHLDDTFSAKDFRTWVACRLAIELYPEAKARKAAGSRSSLVNILVKLVAKELGNTPAVCRQYYLHPSLLACVEKEQMTAQSRHKKSRSAWGLSAVEKLLLDILN